MIDLSYKFWNIQNLELFGQPSEGTFEKIIDSNYFGQPKSLWLTKNLVDPKLNYIKCMISLNQTSTRITCFGLSEETAV